MKRDGCMDQWVDGGLYFTFSIAVVNYEKNRVKFQRFITQPHDQHEHKSLSTRGI